MLRTEAVASGFAAVRSELSLPSLADSAAFPADVQAEARRAAAQHAFAGREDATDLPLVTIDPPDAMDLDQAMLVRRRGLRGFTLYYAIADLGAFVRPAGALDLEAQRRGQTLYLPDAKVPLHPPVLSESAASLLPGQVRPAVLWTIDTDADGEPVDVRVRRVLVRSVARLNYEGVQADVGAGTLHPSITALPGLGRLRRARAVARGAVELELPEQQVEPDGNDGWRIVLRKRTSVDAWNAEMSLLTGMCAAQMMLQAKIGLLRALPEPDSRAVAGLRRSAQAVGVDWQPGASPAEVLSLLNPTEPSSMAVFAEATRLLRGAGYIAFDGANPEHTGHTGIGGPYAHVTAPLRRLVDRYGAEVCLAVAAGVPVPDWTRQALPMLPETMATSDRLAAQAERACLDQVESWLLADRIGDQFDAIVLRVNNSSGRSDQPDQANVFVTDPPVLARCDGDGQAEGARVKVVLREADPASRLVRFEAMVPAGGDQEAGSGADRADAGSASAADAATDASGADADGQAGQ